MLKLAIFDMDGLMLDSERIYMRSALNISKRYNYGITEKTILATMGLNSKASHQRVVDDMGEDFPLEEYLTHLREEYYYFLLNEEIPKKEGLVELLDYLDEKGIKKAVATSTSRYKAEPMLKNAHIYERFDCIVCGDDITKSKPDPQIYQTVLEKMNIQKEEAFVFEDSRNGILSAYNAEIPCILIPDLAYVDDKTKEKASYILKDLKEAITIIENTL